MSKFFDIDLPFGEKYEDTLSSQKDIESKTEKFKNLKELIDEFLTKHKDLEEFEEELKKHKDMLTPGKVGEA